MKLVVVEPLGISNQLLCDLLNEKVDSSVEIVTYPDRKEDPETLIERCQDADIVVVSNIKFPQAVIEGCKNLKYICVAFTGVDHIDLQACKNAGIKVSNCAGYSTSAVADLVFGFVIDLYRNIIRCNEVTRQSGTKAGLIGPELEGKKFGVVGLGAIGSRVARIAQAFDCEVYATSRSPKQMEGVHMVDLDTLLSTCDIVSIHTPQNASTIDLINAEKISLMKKDAILINTARGPIVDSKALADALNEERIAGAGVDVFETEPPIDPNHPLLHAKNCIVTPHVAFASNQAMVKRAKIVAENIRTYLAGNQQNIIL